MKTTARLIFYAGVVITLDCRMLASVGANKGETWKAKGVKEEVPPPRPSFPLLTLPSFSSFSFSGLSFPYLQAFSSPNRMSSAERVRATKTEYLEVTRRQTVHPVCYTAYEAKAPCLPYYPSDFHEDDYDNFDSDAVHQTYDSFNLNEVKNTAQSTLTAQVAAEKVSNFTTEEKLSEEATRTGRYLELKLRREGGVETSSKIEGSEFRPTLIRNRPQHLATDYHTKTVLITKLEKYTDRRVTATLLAVNCLPIERSIPMCQSYPNPIREAPDRRSDGFIDIQAGNNYAPTLTISENFPSEILKMDSEPTYIRNKTVDARTSESLKIVSEESLLSKD